MTDDFHDMAGHASLLRLTSLWRDTRHSRVAHLFRELAAHADEDPNGLQASLSDLTSVRSARAAERLTALSDLCDPRLVDSLIGWFLAFPYRTRAAKPFWDAVFSALSRHAHPDLATQRKALADTMQQTHATNYAAHIASRMRKLEVAPFQPKPISETDEAWLCELETRFPPPAPSVEQPSIDAWMERIARNPDDDAPRRVLADLLQDRGDPRGAFIALQFATLDGEGDPEAERLLVEAHGAKWAGPWLTLVGRVVYQRGFPDRVRIHRRVGKLGKLVGDPNLRTVRSLEVPHHVLNPQAVRALPRVLTHTVLAALREVGTLECATALAIRETLGSQVERLGLWIENVDANQVLDVLNGWPALQHLRVSGDRCDPVTVVALARSSGVCSLEVDVPAFHCPVPFSALLDCHPHTRIVRHNAADTTTLHAERDVTGHFSTVRCIVTAGQLDLDTYAMVPATLALVVDGAVDRVVVRDWRVLPRLAEVQDHVATVYYRGRPEAPPPDFTGMPEIGHLELAYHMRERDYGSIVSAALGCPIRRITVSNVIELTATPAGGFDGRLLAGWSNPSSRRTLEPLLQSIERLRRGPPGEKGANADFDSLVVEHGIREWTR